jgi:hypothetical protein
MAVQIQPSVVGLPLEVFVAEFGVLDLQPFELPNKRYVGRIYRLSVEAVKAVSEAVSFTARFESNLVRVAHFDAYKSTGNAVIEVARNAKPLEIGFRYSADRFSSLEKPTKGNESLRPWLRSTYLVKSLPSKVFATVCDQLKIRFEDRDLFYIRVNFKDLTYALIAEEGQSDKFPIGAFSSFQLPGESIKTVVTLPFEDKVSLPEMVKKVNQVEIERTAGIASNSAKYATYSRSEVDQLLKQQLEQVTATIQSRATGQKKELQDALKTQEKNVQKVVDELHVYSENIKKSLEKVQSAKESSVAESIAQMKGELTEQIDQFKIHLNKSVMPSMKTLEDRVVAIVKSNQAESNVQPSKTNPAGLTLGLIALVIAVVDLVLLLSKH